MSLHYFNAMLNKTPNAVWDFSGVSGAFDASSTLTYADKWASADDVESTSFACVGFD